MSEICIEIFDSEALFLIFEVDINYRRKRARKTVISWFVSQDFEFSEVPEIYKKDLFINEYDYNRQLDRYRVEYKLK